MRGEFNEIDNVLALESVTAGCTGRGGDSEEMDG
jgi:hypothetical protein